MHALRCEGSAKMYGLTILPYDTNFPGLPNRTGSKLNIFIIRKWFRISSIGDIFLMFTISMNIFHMLS